MSELPTTHSRSKLRSSRRAHYCFLRLTISAGRFRRFNARCVLRFLPVLRFHRDTRRQKSPRTPDYPTIWLWPFQSVSNRGTSHTILVANPNTVEGEKSSSNRESSLGFAHTSSSPWPLWFAFSQCKKEGIANSAIAFDFAEKHKTKPRNSAEFPDGTLAHQRLHDRFLSRH